ncbi:MAG: DNA-binding transcriptional ArsR family regulator [Pseudohongiellaceae bacterium]|jgi:DNA-binding transcriptional ArsR family regulator
MPKRFSEARVLDAAPLFAALGDVTRLGLVVRLAAGGPESIAGLSASAHVSRQAITKHLHVLSDAGLAHSFRRGRQQIWELRPDRLGEAHDYLDRIGVQWDAALERLKTFVEED